MKSINKIKKFTNLNLSLAQYFIIVTFGSLFISSFIIFVLVYYGLSHDIFLNIFTGAPFALGIVIFVSIIIGLTTAIILHLKVLMPLNELIKATREIANGNYGVQISEDKQIVEILELHKNFNKMSMELKSTEVMKKNFISMISHELKTPLSVIDGYAKLIVYGGEKDESQVYASKISSSVEKLSSLTDNILLMSDLDNRYLKPQVVSYRLDEQIRESIIDLEAMWKIKNIEFLIDFSPVVVNQNKEILGHVWTNLLKNSINFSNVNGEIECSIIQSDKGMIIVNIKNWGPIILDDEKENIFNAFTKNKNSEGHGIGLAIVKRALELTDSTIIVESERDTGTIFKVVVNTML